jgi:hypothetical protein
MAVTCRVFLGLSLELILTDNGPQKDTVPGPHRLKKISLNNRHPWNSLERYKILPMVFTRNFVSQICKKSFVSLEKGGGSS